MISFIRIWQLCGLVSLCSTTPLHAGGQESHGADGIVLADAKEVILLDDAECSETIFPEDYEQAWAQIEESLASIKDDLNLPNTANYLRSFLSNGRLQWCFIDGHLQDLEDEGEVAIDLERYLGDVDRRALFDPYSLDSALLPDGGLPPLNLTDQEQDDEVVERDIPDYSSISPVSLALGKHQIAINSVNGTVKISRILFDRLTNRGIAKLFIHEALWHAAGFTLVKNGRPIRDVSNLLLDDLSRYRADRFVQKLVNLLKPVGNKSPLVRRAQIDLRQQRQRLSPFVLEEHDTPYGYTIEVKVKSPETDILALTSPNPNPGAQVVYADKYNQIYFVNFSKAEPTYTQTSIERLCQDAGLPDQKWRLPTEAEVFQLAKLGLFAISFADKRHYIYSTKSADFKDVRLTPVVTDKVFLERIPILTEAGTIIDPIQKFRRIQQYYPGLDDGSELSVVNNSTRYSHLSDQLVRQNIKNITYPIYFCVSK